MSEPARLENGYLRLANELADAFCRYPFRSAEERRVLDAVIRLTYGYGRGSAAIGLQRFGSMTGLPQRTIERCLARLVEAGVLLRVPRRGTGGSKKASVWKVNKRPASWVWPPGPGPDEPVHQAPRRSRYSAHREPAAPERPVGRPESSAPASSEPGPEVDPLTRQLLDEGYKGRSLLLEFQKRRRGQPVDNSGDSRSPVPTCTDSGDGTLQAPTAVSNRGGESEGERTDRGDGTSSGRTDSGDGTFDGRTDSPDGTSPSRARARDVPTARSDGRTDSTVGTSLKDMLKDSLRAPARAREEGQRPAPDARSPDGPAGPAGGAGQTPSSQATEPWGTSPPDRQPARPDRGPRHVGDLLPAHLAGGSDR